MKFGAFLFFLTCCFQVFAQKEIKVEFPAAWYTTPKSGSGIMPMYEYTGDTIFHAGDWHVITLPPSIKDTSTSWGFEYFTGIKNAKIERQVLIVAADYKSLKSRIYVDYNGNLDITDDGPPLTPDSANKTIIYLHNSEVPDGQFGLEIFPAEYFNAQSRKNTEDHFLNSSSGKNKILPSDYWFSVCHLNWRIAEKTINKKTVRIGLFDENCDGLIRLNSGDNIIACNNEQEISSRLSHGAVKLSDTTLIRVNEKVYRVTRVDSLGNFIFLKPSKLKIDRLGPGCLIPDFAFLNIDSTNTSLYKKLSPRKYNLIYLWGSWCAPCTNALPILQEIAERYSDKLNVIGLNTGENPATIRKYIEMHHVSWYTGMATREMIKELLVDAWPYYALIDENKKIVRLYISLDEVKQILEGDR